MSAADLMAVLLAEHLRYDFTAPGHPGNDRLIFSKGHASPLLYAMYRAAGVIDDDELLSFRALGSRLEGHPTPRLPWVDVATGSLGLGLPGRGQAWRWPPPGWSTAPTRCGCCAGTANWPRARCGRRSSTPDTSGWTTSPRSST